MPGSIKIKNLKKFVRIRKNYESKRLNNSCIFDLIIRATEKITVNLMKFAVIFFVFFYDRMDIREQK